MTATRRWAAPRARNCSAPSQTSSSSCAPTEPSLSHHQAACPSLSALLTLRRRGGVQLRFPETAALLLTLALAFGALFGLLYAVYLQIFGMLYECSNGSSCGSLCEGDP